MKQIIKKIAFTLFVIASGTLAQAADDNSVLLPVFFKPLPLGEIKPSGWLKNQLRIQANGLSGHLDEFWPDIAQSGWIGGNAEGWERGPYWLDGVVPLAYLLDDSVLKTKVRRWIDYIIIHQQPDGWLGPIQAKDRQAYDPWPEFIILKAMSQYAQASGDPRVVPAMIRCCQKLNTLLDSKPLFDWSKPRWGDLVLSVYWLYDRNPQPWLLELAAKVHKQGLDWKEHFADFKYKEKMLPADINYSTHGVNNAMSLKAYPLWYRQSHDPTDRDEVYNAIATLDKYHGQATGIFTCDEHYAGLNPSQGTELCTVAEYMFSMETLLSLLGNPQFGDRLERIAFNNLPATFKPDMWAHQFDQQANQVICAAKSPAIYTVNFPDSGTFGLEPCYGCCTSNMHQAWPKFASHLWMKKGDNGLAAVAYAPSIVKTEVNGIPVEVELKTDYPFSDKLSFTVKTKNAVTFTLYLRIPQWTQKPRLTIENEKPVTPKPGIFYPIQRQWKGTTKLTLQLPMPVRTQRRYHNGVSIERGPIVYVLKIAENWKLLKGKLPHADWEVYPASAWNYAVAIDTNDTAKSLTFRERPAGNYPFSSKYAPLEASVKGKRLPQWIIETNAAGPLPQSPVDSNEPLENLTLVPYGCTHLRITEFPLLRN
ncbi:MAG: beta-L-arabinofuranosidase domain-containing protein [Phycisphaerae bacterium]|jgi:hypothetical protein